MSLPWFSVYTYCFFARLYTNLWGLMEFVQTFFLMCEKKVAVTIICNAILQGHGNLG